MGEYIFYSIMIDGKFVNSNLMRNDTENIVEAIRFSYLEDAKYYFEQLNPEMNFKIVKVDCTVKEL